MSEWCVFKRTFLKETKMLMEKEKLKDPPSLQAVKASMESSGAYAGIFIETS